MAMVLVGFVHEHLTMPETRQNRVKDSRIVPAR